MLGLLALALVCAALLIGWRFNRDMQQARTRAAQGSVLLQTRCGPIEYQEAGTGVPLLAVHGSGGGHDQGMPFAAKLAQHGIRVIAMSRFGYLRTSMPADASAAALADVHACLLDALGIRRAAVMGGSAGAPSALQMAIRHPDRVSALVLLVLLGHTSRRPRPIPHLAPSPLQSIRAPTLVINARDDRCGTYASAQYTASLIAGARFIGFDEGGHTWVGHDDEVREAIIKPLIKLPSR